MADKSCPGKNERRGAKRSPPLRFVFMKPANDNKASVGLNFRRFLALAILTLLALSAFWANSPRP